MPSVGLVAVCCAKMIVDVVSTMLNWVAYIVKWFNKTLFVWFEMLTLLYSRGPQIGRGLDT